MATRAKPPHKIPGLEAEDRLDSEYLEAIGDTLSEWDSAADEQAYNQL